MSQGTCAICDKECDGRAGIWEGNYHSKICSICIDNLISRFKAFFGTEGHSWGEWGLEIEWADIHKILSNIKRDYAMRVSYITTEKEEYERTKKIKVPILPAQK